MAGCARCALLHRRLGQHPPAVTESRPIHHVSPISGEGPLWDLVVLAREGDSLTWLADRGHPVSEGRFLERRPVLWVRGVLVVRGDAASKLVVEPWLTYGALATCRRGLVRVNPRLRERQARG